MDKNHHAMNEDTSSVGYFSQYSYNTDLYACYEMVIYLFGCDHPLFQSAAVSEWFDDG